MGKKSNHKHLWVKCIKDTHRDSPVFKYDLVMRCSVCGRIKPADYKDRIIKEDGRYRYLHTYEDFVAQFGNLDVIEGD